MNTILIETMKELVKNSIGVFILLSFIWLATLYSSYDFKGGVFSVESILSAIVIYTLCNLINIALGKVNFYFKDGKK